MKSLNIRFTLPAGKPFNDRQASYQVFIAAGKYVPRVEQKKAAEKQQIRTMTSGTSALLNSDWRYSERLFQARLATQKQLNLFAEIAGCDEDLMLATSVSWPRNIPGWIADTACEMPLH